MCYFNSFDDKILLSNEKCILKSDRNVLFFPYRFTRLHVCIYIQFLIRVMHCVLLLLKTIKTGFLCYFVCIQLMYLSIIKNQPPTHTCTCILPIIFAWAKWTTPFFITYQMKHLKVLKFYL